MLWHPGTKNIASEECSCLPDQYSLHTVHWPLALHGYSGEREIFTQRSLQVSLSWSPPGVTLAFSHPHTLPRARCGHRIHKDRVVQQPASCPVTDSNSKVCPFPHFSSFQIQMSHSRWQRKCSHGFCLAGLQNTGYLPVDGISDLMTHSVLTGDCPQRLLRTCWPWWGQPTHSQVNTATSTNHA